MTYASPTKEKRYDVFYSELGEQLQLELVKLRLNEPSCRIVVFVNDLYKCNPEKALEIVESMRSFLAIDGIIYILGLSLDIVKELTDIKYKETGVEGKQYIKKIIQIPINLPKWDNKDISILIQDFIDKNLIREDYKDIIDLDLISTAVE